MATLQKLGIVPSFSRPSVSNDNPFSESLLKLLNTVHNSPPIPLTQSKRHKYGAKILYNGTTTITFIVASNSSRQIVAMKEEI